MLPPPPPPPHRRDVTEPLCSQKKKKKINIGCIVDGFWFDKTIVSPFILKVVAEMLLF
jgi:hypothetical protein